ncbi:MAG: UPF0158 family protein [Planctomycetota bacterium]
MLTINADALFRAITATGYKLLAFNLDLRTGEIVSRTLAPSEVSAPPDAPSIKPLPKMGGDLSHKKDKPLFTSSQPAAPKPKLFDDDDKKPAFDGDFWKRDEKKKPGLFGDFKREHGSKKLAEMFGDAPKAAKVDPFTKSTEPAPADYAPIPSTSNDPYYPRIPAVSEETQLDWMRQFAKDSGDPLIREELVAALHSPKPSAAFERALRNHLRTSQQWERYLRKQALASAEAWLASLGVTWELIGK